MRLMIMLAVLAPLTALAFTFESTISHGCHEQITRAAALRGGWLETTLPAQTAEDRALAAAMPFAAGEVDRWTLALMIGVRDVDTQGVTPSDLPELAGIHNGPHQEGHCLRGADDDGDEGEAHAIAACRAFILDELALAIGEGELIDLDQTESVKVGLWTGSRMVELSRYGFHLGRALHAVQDSYSHGARVGGAQVATLFNYLEPGLASYHRDRDGPPHSSEWDGCVEEDTKPRVEGATAASARVMQAVGSPGTHEQRLARAAAVVDGLLAPATGCEESNQWCQTLPRPTGCSQSAGLPMVVLAVLLLRRSRAGVAGMLVVAALGASTGRAEPLATNVHLVAGASIDRGSGAFGVGLGVDLSERWALSFDAEFSPWFDVLTARSSAGTARLYASGHFAWARFGALSLRSSAELGASMLLSDVPGASAGSVGVVLGLSLIGLRVQASPHVVVEVIPDVMLDAPSLRGVPFVYREYRLIARVGWSF
jgi:hypothetical protein